MAIDLASDTSTVNWESMLPLEMLAAVATETLNNEINVPKSDNKPTDSRRQSKKSTTTIASIETLPTKTLSTKSLVNKFSVLTSDEMNKKYSFRCKLLPGECSVTYQSFGNEKKALDRMKLHLISHLNQLKRGFRLPLLYEKRSKSAKKAKKFLKSSKSSFHHSLVAPESPKKFRKITSHEKIKKHSFKGKTKKAEPTYACDDLLTEYDCHVFSAHTNPIFINQEAIEEDFSSNLSTSPVKDKLDDLSESHCVIQDHNYASVDGVPSVKPVIEVCKPLSEMKKISPCRVPPQFIVKTPSFPHVHIPLLPDVAEIKEYTVDCHIVDPLQHEDMDYVLPPNTSSPQPKEPLRKNINCKKISRLKKREAVSSVLECVENKVDVKPSVECLSKTSYPPNENTVENVENMQKIEKELALKLIAKLHLKRKKQYQGPLECQICQDKHFTALATLIHHYRSHAGIKPYTCNLCAATFTRQHSLNYHMLIHQNLSRFRCAFCGRTFRHPSHYKEHLRRHTGETPFRCHDCNLHFKTRNTFKRHLKIRHKKLLTAHGIEDLIEEELRKV